MVMIKRQERGHESQRWLLTFLSAGLLAFALFGSIRAIAQTPSELARCSALADNVARLNCYDAVVPRLPDDQVRSSAYRKIELIELKVDRDVMKGQLVETSGTLSQVGVGDTLLLRTGALDTSPVLVDFKAVFRDQRRWVFDNCNLGCTAIVRGKVGFVAFQTGIVAD